MRILASVVALVLVGLTGGWLWLDATAQARQDTKGVVITGPVDAATATALVGTPQGEDAEAAPETGTSTSTTGTDAGGDAADAGPTASEPARASSLDQVVTLLSATSRTLLSRADDTRQADKEAAEAEEKAAKEAAKEAAEKAEKAEKEAQKEAEEQRKAEEKAAEEQRRAEPIPVQPAPVTPGWNCEWDDDDAEWDCDDDWDDDDDR